MSEQIPPTPKRSQRKQNKQSSIWGKLRVFIGILLILFALGLFAMDPIKNKIIEDRTEENTVGNLTREQIQANEQAEVTYNWDDIVTLDAFTVLSENVKASELPTIGGLAMPDLDMNLPIHKGVSNAGMYLGAGTLYPEQVMGESNYSLASHHSVNENLLFAPLMRVEMGDTIYITDLNRIYEYEVNYFAKVPETAIELTFPTETPTITLITCDYGLVDRFVVQGVLVNDVAIEDASQAMLEAFDIPQTIAG